MLNVNLNSINTLLLDRSLHSVNATLKITVLTLTLR